MKEIEPPRLKCSNCGGKKWFPSAVGEIACQVCYGTGLGRIDIDALVADWRRLKAKEGRGQPEWISEALNSGDGTYKP
jgi:hypothetical protein